MIITKYIRITLLILLGIGLTSLNAGATELGNLCWHTASGTLLEFSVTQSGSGHYTYTGIFDDGDGVNFAIIGEVEAVSGGITGSFSGSKTSSTYFRTGIFLVTLTPQLSGTVTGIRNTYSGGTIVTDYHTTTVTPTSCP